MDLEQRLRQGPLRVRTAWSAEQSARLPRQVVRLRRRRSLARALFGAGALVCVAAALFARASLRANEPASVAASAPVSAMPALAAATPASAPVAITLHDGSRAEPIDHDSRLAVISDRPGRVQLQLEHGGARFDVVHNPERVFEVQAGLVLVRVAGTIFDVTRSGDGSQTTVAVERGRVHVTWDGQTSDVVAGESRIFPPPQAKAESHEPQAAHKSESAVGWRDLARRGEYRQAYSALHGARTHVQDSPEDLMLAADVARLSGHPEQAVQQLRAVSDRFPNDPRAPVAAFTLGGVLLHELEQPRAAASAFHRARSLWSQGPLALDAWASEAEALHSAGDTHEAAQLAARYLASHPDGRHARSMRALASAE